MNKFDRELRQMAAKEKITMPDPVRMRMEATFLTLPKIESKQKQMRLIPRMALIAACMAFALVFIMPNVSVAYAQSMEKIPVIGDLIRVVTIRNYFYSDPNHEMDIDVPNVSDIPNGEAAQHINKDVDTLTKDLMHQFYADLEGIGKQGHSAMYVDYNVLTNTERWFTMKISAHIVEGSSASYYKYYNVDRSTGEVIKLADLFDTADFNQVLTEEIKRQMREQMDEDSNLVYFMKKAGFGFEFANVGEEHNFYFNEDGELVIPFDKYEVAPGSMGSPEFAIKKEVIQDIVKEKYLDIMQ